MKVFIALLALAVVVAANHEGHDHHDHDHDHGHEHGHEHGHGHDDDYVVKTHEDLVHFRSTCKTKLDIPEDHVEKYKKWEFPDDEKTHCYMKCIFEEFGFFDGEHGFDVKKIHRQLQGKDGHVDHSDETHAKIEHCADKNTEGSDACAWAYRGGMCFIKENLRLVQHSVETH